MADPATTVLDQKIPDLSALLPERQKFRIDGTVYELKRDGDFSLFELRQLNQLVVRLSVIEGTDADTFTEELSAEHDDVSNELVAMLLDSTPAVVSGMGRDIRTVIVTAFLEERVTNPAAKMMLQKIDRIQAMKEERAGASTGSSGRGNSKRAGRAGARKSG